MLCHDLHTPSSFGTLVSVAGSIPGNHMASSPLTPSHPPAPETADALTCAGRRGPGTALEQTQRA